MESCFKTLQEKGSNLPYSIPSNNQLEGLRIEVYFLFGIYTATLIYATFNVYVFLIGQKRFKNILISATYFFSIVVLVNRMCLYIYILRLYNQMENHIDEFKENPLSIPTARFSDMVDTSRHLGCFYEAADYGKLALGFVQLASMAELAIVIRYTVLACKLTLQITKPKGQTS